MRILLVGGLLVSLLSTLHSAPVPKGKSSTNERIEKLFGRISDSDSSYEFSLNDEALRIRVPNEVNRLPDRPNGFGVPHVAKEISGDFTASVRIKVSKFDEKVDESTVITTGIFVLAESGNYLEHSRTIQRNAGKDLRQGLLRAIERNSTSTASSGGGAFDPDATHHKLVRAGNTIAAYASADGKGGWHKLGEWKLELSEKVKVGVHVGHKGGPYTVEFSDFVITEKK